MVIKIKLGKEEIETLKKRGIIRIFQADRIIELESV